MSCAATASSSCVEAQLVCVLRVVFLGEQSLTVADCDVLGLIYVLLMVLKIVS